MTMNSAFSSYSSLALEHFYQPRYVGEWSAGHPHVYSSYVTAGNGERVQFQLCIDECGVVTEARFKARGGVATIACCSFLTQHLHNKPLSAAVEVTAEFLLQALELPAIKQHCALLVIKALKMALTHYSLDV